MMIRPKPRLVAKSTPVLRLVTLEQAANLYPDSPTLQAGWLAAVKYHRARSQLSALSGFV